MCQLKKYERKNLVDLFPGQQNGTEINFVI